MEHDAGEWAGKGKGKGKGKEGIEKERDWLRRNKIKRVFVKTKNRSKPKSPIEDNKNRKKERKTEGILVKRRKIRIECSSILKKTQTDI